MENLISVNDVVQGITSGNGSKQTKITYAGLKNKLNSFEMRNVLGGSGTGIVCFCECSGVWFAGSCAGSSVSVCNSYNCAGVDCTNYGCIS